MLTKLRLENFQKHKDRTINIGPGVTSIVGPTEAGKSAIMRALTWVCLNQGAAGGFISHGCTATKVTLEVDDYEIARRRNTKANQYELRAIGSEEVLESWSAIRSGVPGRVAEILATPEVCFQGQHDSAFWLSQSAGEVGRAVNAVVDLSVIDAALTMVNGMAQKAALAETILGDQLKEANAQVASLAWVEGMGVRWDALVRDKLDLGDLVDIRNNLSSLLTKADTATREAKLAIQRAEAAKTLIMDAGWIDNGVQHVLYIEQQLKNSERYKAYKDAVTRTQELMEQGAAPADLERGRADLARDLAALDKNTGPASMLEATIALQEQARELSDLEKSRRDLVGLLNAVAEYRRQSAKIDEEIASLEEEIAAMPEQEPEPTHKHEPASQGRPGKCPTCGQPWSRE